MQNKKKALKHLNPKRKKNPGRLRNQRQRKK